MKGQDRKKKRCRPSRREFKEGKREDGRKIFRDKEGRAKGGRGVAKSRSCWVAVLFS